MAVIVETTGVAEDLQRRIMAEVDRRMARLSFVPQEVLARVEAGEGVYGTPLPTPKRGGAPLQGKGDLLSPSRFSISALGADHSRTFTFAAPDYYTYLVQAGYAFVLDGQLNPRVTEKILAVLAEG